MTSQAWISPVWKEVRHQCETDLDKSNRISYNPQSPFGALALLKN